MQMIVRKFFSFIVGLIIFSGLPFIGWGLNDINGFIHNPFRLTYIIMMAVLSVLVVIFVPEEGRSRGEGKKLVKRQKISLLFLQILPPLIILLSPFFDHRGIAVFRESSSIRFIGLILSFSGFIIMNWSVMVLGRQFSVDVTIQEDHKLVTNGPYKYIRHPRYSGIVVFFSGISLIFLSWISLAIVLLLIFVLLWRISDEEKLMQQEFGKGWEKYKKRTFSLIPFIY
jgi:protein-S-isoprenylcysteine O-methyltransferase Ste14